MNGNNILYGKEPANAILKEVSDSLLRLKTAGINPRLVTIQVGEDPASKTYLASQMRSAEKVGIKSELLNHPDYFPIFPASNSIAAFQYFKRTQRVQ